MQQPQQGGAIGGQMVVGESEQQVVEEASPISSRPPESSGGGLMVEEDADRGRWPRQETLALIQIRSEMDGAFRDATVKAPLWEHVSRKLAELGYKRSAKKCKEKFENVHKYYKRSKEGRGGRQDGKSYRFFSQLEALHNVTSPPSTTVNVLSHQQIPTSGLDVAPVSVGIPVPMSSQPPLPPSTSHVFPPGFATTSNINPPPTSLGLSFSSDASSSSSPSSEDGDEIEGGSRKRKRESHHRGETRQMMEFFQGLMKQVMQKQEAMQQRFLEAIEKREQDRMIREEAWKRQEMSRLSREHEIIAQERAVSASRDAAILSFLQKLTGQTIHLPSPPPPPPPPAAPPQPPPQPPQIPIPPLVTTQPQQQSVQQVAQAPPPSQQDKPQKQVHRQQAAASSDIIMAIPEQQVPPQTQQMEMVSMSGGMEAGSSSRWPKAEVIALINLRSRLETRYQEACAKGPLWEEISAGMQRLGYTRSSKRCKEKWENINKYYKKVKESNKKRPEDSKTCPYFHQLDALYRKKILAEAPTTGLAIQTTPEDQRQPENRPSDQANVVQQTQASESETKNDATNTSMGAGGATKKPEDIVKELMEEQRKLMVDDIGDDESEEDDDDENESQDESKMDYKIEFQRQNTNQRRNGTPPSFLAMVQ